MKNYVSSSDDLPDSPASVGEFLGQMSFYRLPDGRIATLVSPLYIADSLEAVRVVTLLTSYAAKLSKNVIADIEGKTELVAEYKKLQAKLSEESEWKVSEVKE
jgi:hypothetical protein